MIEGEQRKSRRFLIQLPVVVRWTDENLIGEAVTLTLDVSSRGLRFDLPKSLKGGLALEMLMTLPHEVTHAGPVRVNCKGRVVRTSLKGSDKVEVVAAIQRYQFVRNSENPAA
ncbi:MAG: PilZ domain-containing protein [Candidatus Acidiferrales bacterium]